MLKVGKYQPQKIQSSVHHPFLYTSLPVLVDYDVKMPNFTFYGLRKQATTKFVSLSEPGYDP